MDEIQNIKFEEKIGKSIESIYILKNIISFLSEKQKLNLIIYNKCLQKELDLNIEDYKKISGIYREGERNGKGKEYNISNNKMIFEGEYLNGRRNGKGKEYNQYGKLEFEGEYLNGRRNGKGKEYSYGDLRFEGEYLNGRRNGKGKEFYDESKLKYEGEYLNGERNEKGKEYYYDGKLKYERIFKWKKKWKSKRILF